MEGLGGAARCSFLILEQQVSLLNVDQVRKLEMHQSESQTPSAEP